MILLLRKPVVILLVLLHIFLASGQISRDQLFSFGSSNGDAELLGILSDPITLKSPFTFYNKTYTILYVNGYGSIDFGEPGARYFHGSCNSKYLTRSDSGIAIAPLWSIAFMKNGNGGHIYYRETTDPSLISKARDDVKKGFPDVAADLSFKSIFIATWDNVTRGDGDESYMCFVDKIQNTFQVILASDGKKSFVIFYYNELTWSLYSFHKKGTKGFSCVSGTVYFPAAGFTAGARQPFQYTLGDCESDVGKLTEKSNVGEMGKWVFQVDNEIESPTFRDSKEIVQSVSSGRINSFIGFYFCTMLLIVRVYI